jgi:hypothetical protein
MFLIMNRHIGKLFTLAFFTGLFALSAISAAAQQRYEGVDVILDAPAKGGTKAVRFSNYGAIRVSLPYAQVTACNGSSLQTVSGLPNVTVVTTDTATPATDHYLRWCFETSNPNFTLSWQSSDGISYSGLKWLPESSWNGFVSVKDFGAVGDGTTDDTQSIRNALLYIGAKTGGTLYFPVGRYKVTQTLTLPSGIVLQGANGRTSTSFFLGDANFKNQTNIIYAGNPVTDPAIFRIGELEESIRIKDIELLGTGAQYTYGIEAVGLETSPGFGTTQLISFENTVFTKFDIGLYVHNGEPKVGQPACSGTPATCDEWHFDYVKVDSCQFTHNRSAGIHIDTFNTDWNISNTNFGLPKKEAGVDADAIFIRRAGGVNLQTTFAGGDTPSTPGGDFLDVKGIGGLTIINSGAEALARGLVFGDGAPVGSLSSVITMVNSAMPVELTKTVNFISTGNHYGGQSVVASSEGVRIWSTGDRFCYDSSFPNPCGVTLPLPAGQKIGFQGIGKIMFQTGQPKDGPIPAIPTILNEFINPSDDIVLKATTPHVAGTEKILLELGHDVLDANGDPVLDANGKPAKFAYHLSRDKDNGYLKFTGTQGSPWQGYIFDSPIRLPTRTLAQIYVDGGVAGEGAVIYCKDCIPNTSPCQAGGTGALAIGSTSQWNCK